MTAQAQIKTVPFHGQMLSVIPQQNKLFVAIKPVCENMGVQWRGQNQRILRDDVLSATACMMHAVAADGKNRDLLCLPLEFLNGWMFGIDTNRIKNPEVKARVIEYKKECYQALFDYWTKGEAVNPRAKRSDVADRKALNIAVRSLANARSEAGKKADFAGVWRIVHGYLGVESISDATTEQVQQALGFVQKAIEGEYISADAKALPDTATVRVPKSRSFSSYKSDELYGPDAAAGNLSSLIGQLSNAARTGVHLQVEDVTGATEELLALRHQVEKLSHKLHTARTGVQMASKALSV